MKVAIITFSTQGYVIGNALKKALPESDLFIHDDIHTKEHHSFLHIRDIIGSIFNNYTGIIFISPCGIAVRAISPYIQHKTTDPAVVVIDVGGRFAVSLLSGHEGGANDLTYKAANIINAEPCISTTTEAIKTITAGIGCRKGISASTIIEAIREACSLANIAVESIRTIASAQIKASEQGLIYACAQLKIPLRILPDWRISRCEKEFDKSSFVESITGLPAVAEPAALVSGRNTSLLLRKHVYQGVTIALAKEHFLWSE